MWVRSVAKRVCLLWTNGVACHISKQRMLGPSSHQPLQPHTPNQLCTLRGFRMERNRMLALRAEVFIRISMIARLASSPTESVKVKAKFTQSCPTLCDPMYYTVHGILQARILKWVAFPFSSGSSQPRNRTRVTLLQVDFLPTELSGKPASPV